VQENYTFVLNKLEVLLKTDHYKNKSEAAMIRRYFALAATVLFLFTSVNAQNVDRSGGYARVLSLGNNPYVVDPEGIKVNPAWASEYYNFLWGDIGSNSGAAFGNSSAGQFAGFNFRLADGFTLGALLTANDFNSISIARLDPFGIVGQLNGIVGPGTVVPLNNNLEAIASFKLGSSMALGLGVAYAASKNETTPATGNGTVGKASQLGINAGILANFTRSLMLDLGVSIMMPSASFEPATGNATEVSQSIIAANGRVFFRYNNNVRFVPTVGFLTSSGTIDAGGTSTDAPSVMAVGFGFGLEYSTGDFLIVGGPALASLSTTTPAVANVTPELSTSAFVFPVWNLGGEWNATDWLIARVGYTAFTGNTTTESAATTTTINEVTTTFYGTPGVSLGLGLRFGGFSLDATVNDDVLRQGLGNIGGGPTFAYISGSFAF
jgi:hypothetical protein